MNKKALSPTQTAIGIVIMVIVIILIIGWIVPGTSFARTFVDWLSPSQIVGNDKSQELLNELESGIDYCCNINKQLAQDQNKNCGYFAVLGEFSPESINPPSICQVLVSEKLSFQKDKQTCTKAILTKNQQGLVVTLEKAESSSKCK